MLVTGERLQLLKFFGKFFEVPGASTDGCTAGGDCRAACDARFDWNVRCYSESKGIVAAPRGYSEQASLRKTQMLN